MPIDARLAQLARWHRRPLHRALWRVVVAAGLLAVFILLLLHSSAEDPEKNLRESRRALEALQPPPVPDSENAALDYTKAFKAIVPYVRPTGGPYNNFLNDPTQWIGNHPYALEQPDVQAFLTANATAFAFLEAAVQKQSCDWKADHYARLAGRPMLTNFVDRMDFAARMFLLRARDRAHRNDHAGAARDVAAAVRIVKHAETDLLLMGYLNNAIPIWINRAVQGIVMFDTPSLAEDISAYRAALGKIPDPKELYVRQTECWSALVLCYMDYFASQTISGNQVPQNLRFVNLTASYRLLYGSDRRTFRACRDEALQLARAGTFHTGTALLQKNQRGPAPFSRLLVGGFRYPADYLNSGERRLGTDAALALLQYRAARGRDPKSLDELCPEYLPAVPIDFSHGLPLREKIAEKEFEIDVGGGEWITFHPGTVLIYSRGANGKDDNGDDSELSIRMDGRKVSGDDVLFVIPAMKAK